MIRGASEVQDCWSFCWLDWSTVRVIIKNLRCRRFIRTTSISSSRPSMAHERVILRPPAEGYAPLLLRNDHNAVPELYVWQRFRSKQTCKREGQRSISFAGAQDGTFQDRACPLRRLLANPSHSLAEEAFPP